MEASCSSETSVDFQRNTRRYSPEHRTLNNHRCESLRSYRHITHSLMELSSSWEVANCAATQELPSILWNPKVHYRVQKSSPLVPILNQINPIYTIHPISLRPILILFTHLHLGLPNGLLLSGFPDNILYAFLLSPFVLHACPSHPPWLNHSNYTWRKVQVMKLLIM
jgi:hypothetical protein